jgi:hypothetical protein
MTPDGIAGADWDAVHELTLEMLNCAAAEDPSPLSRARASLMELLDRLDQKYGAKPSLLATRADFVDSSDEKERLLLAAYSEAERIADAMNRELIAHSLAQFYIDEIGSVDEGRKWLGVWRDELGIQPGAHDVGELARLESILLKKGAAW